jgi:hypothetical protein
MRAKQSTWSETNDAQGKSQTGERPEAAARSSHGRAIGGRGSSGRPSSRAAARSASGDGTTPRNGSAKGHSIIDLTIDIPDDDSHLIEVVADLLLDLVQRKRERESQ